MGRKTCWLPKWVFQEALYSVPEFEFAFLGVLNTFKACNTLKMQLCLRLQREMPGASLSQSQFLIGRMRNKEAFVGELGLNNHPALIMQRFLWQDPDHRGVTAVLPPAAFLVG